MSQLDDFREQLRSARPVEEEKEQTKTEVHATPPPRKARKKIDTKDAHTSVWLHKDVQRKAKLLALWMEAEGIPRPGSIGELFAEAFDTLVDTKYPKAKKYVEMK